MQQSFGRWNKFFLIAITLIFGLAILLQWNFPAQLRKIHPQTLESHPARDMTSDIRNFDNLNAKFFNQKEVSMCEDVQIDDNLMAYCVNENNDVISIDTKSDKVQVIGKVEKGRAYGIKLSSDQTLLYFVNSQMGLCEFNIQTKKVTVLAAEHEGKFLIAIDEIEVHPTNPNILYVTQASDRIPLDKYKIDIMLNNPLGRLLEFNKQTKKISLIADGLYFANGVVFQRYKNQQTVLVSETNRFRLTRVYVSGQKKGHKQIVVDKIDLYCDNIYANQKGQIWVAGPVGRDFLLAFADRHSWIRTIITRLPYEFLQFIPQTDFTGGMKVTFSDDQQSYKVDYFIWKLTGGYRFVTTLNQKNGSLFVSSLQSKGVWKIPHINEKLAKSSISSKRQQKDDQAL